MNAMDAEESLKPYEAPYDNDPYSRASLVIGSKDDMNVIHMGDPGFRSRMEQNFVDVESNCLEQTYNLKAKLRASTTFDFWQILMEGMSEIMGAQYSFVAKRVLYDDENAAVEMPPFGQPGSCLMGLAFYFNDHKGQSGLYRDYKYQVYGCPCQWMRHDKVLIIPDGLTTLTPSNPNSAAMPILPEGYLAVPLFQEGKCFAHFGVMWTADGLKERPQLGWGMLEMFLHALEDQVTIRMLEGKGFTERPNEVIPAQVVASRQSFRPYARSLSHELRTPMQGVVGMLDVMYASVLEATEWEIGDMKQIRNMVESLRESIEVAQGAFFVLSWLGLNVYRELQLIFYILIQTAQDAPLMRRITWFMLMISIWKFPRPLHILTILLSNKWKRRIRTVRPLLQNSGPQRSTLRSLGHLDEANGEGSRHHLTSNLIKLDILARDRAVMGMNEKTHHYGIGQEVSTPWVARFYLSG